MLFHGLMHQSHGLLELWSSQSKTVQSMFCVDFRQLNESVLREVHLLPKVGEILALLHDAVMLYKVDANCGFWQVPLENSSKPLTTFTMLFGRYKLPLALAMPPEHCQ